MTAEVLQGGQPAEVTHCHDQIHPLLMRVPPAPLLTQIARLGEDAGSALLADAQEERGAKQQVGGGGAGWIAGPANKSR